MSYWRYRILPLQGKISVVIQALKGNNLPFLWDTLQLANNFNELDLFLNLDLNITSLASFQFVPSYSEE